MNPVKESVSKTWSLRLRTVKFDDSCETINFKDLLPASRGRKV